MTHAHQCPNCGTVEPLLTLDEHAGAMQSDPTQSFHDLATENATLKRQLDAAHDLLDALDEHAGAMEAAHDLLDAAGGAMAQNREAMTALQHRVNTAEDMYDRECIKREKFNRMAVRVGQLEECLQAVMYVNTIGGGLRDRIAELIARKEYE